MISTKNKSRHAEPTAIVAGVPIKTSAGVFTATFSEAGLRELNFPNGATPRSCPPVSAVQSKWSHQIALAIEDLLGGREPRTLPPLDWDGATEFRQRVWRELLKISPGKTRTYSEIAERLGAPGAARAVGSACGANPMPVIVPCHRVLAVGGRLGGFSGGLDWKRRLLAAENSGLL